MNKCLRNAGSVKNECVKQRDSFVCFPFVSIIQLKYLETKNNTEGIFLETAHPVKFLDVVEKEINETIEIPQQIKEVIDKDKVAKIISNYSELKKLLIDSN